MKKRNGKGFLLLLISFMIFLVVGCASEESIQGENGEGNNLETENDNENEASESENNNYNNRSEEHTSELQSRGHLVCRLLLEKKKKNNETQQTSKNKQV